AIGPLDIVEPCQITFVGCRSMIGLMDREEAPRSASVRLQPDWKRLDRRAANFMLQSAIGQASTKRKINASCITMVCAKKLHRVGRERARALETAVHHLRMLSVL